MMLTCTQRNLVVHILVQMINTSVPVSENCTALVTFVVNNANHSNLESPLWLIAGVALLNTNIAFSSLKNKTQFLCPVEVRYSCSHHRLCLHRLSAAVRNRCKAYACHTIPFSFVFQAAKLGFSKLG